MGRPKKFDPDVAVGQAMDVFWSKGYGATTPNDLVVALGIGKGSLYHAFGSKHALFEKALERYRDDQAAGLIDLLDRPGAVKERLRTALEFIVAANVADPRGCMVVNTATELGNEDPALGEQVRRQFGRTQSAFRAAIEEGQRSGEIDPGRDPEALSYMILSTVLGLQVLARAGKGPDRMNQVVDGLIDSL
ncbi:TetR/AcrR family transcriptional regulator [Actinomadura rupiterrae]|uniref:TetR/AcrR family transcriptional regulator n=1 Tax=Actinomadura rupiterrae TaxID=559627 RepID=UPI0020A605EF|nr:TetR/AcrR family transcriptional regulator [Actinomadura rupiterrae]MCP2334892.1 TetR/AcrR family transcriptional repressor of nem operon [Actinomadura rupiterrae]